MRKPTLILALTLLLPAAVSAQAPDPGGEYLRLTRDTAGAPVALQAPIFTFETDDSGPQRLSVDLVGAIHVADESYFEALNDRFTGYDAVLYELVAPEGARPRPNAAPGNLVSGMQMGITRLLELSFQLDQIDYAAANFVHADLTPEAMTARMSERGETTFTYLLRLLTAPMDDAAILTAAADAPGIFELLLSPDRPRLLKTLMANTMLDVETFSRIIDGDSGSSLVADRNARAIEVLEDRIRAGDRRIAIFYGVAHLPDLAERLRSDIGLTHRGTIWIDSWNLQAGPSN